MPTFSYKAVDSLGKETSGEMIADNQQALIKILSEKGYVVTSIEKEKEEKKWTFWDRFKGIRNEDLSSFTTQLATMVSSGLSLPDCLEDLSSQTENLRFQKILKKIKEEVIGGKDLSSALSKYPAIFPPIYVNMVQAGEVGGALEVILKRLSSFLEQENNLRQKIRTAMTYPLVLLAVAVLVIIFILVNFIPKFVALFSRMGVSLPLPTLILYQGSLILQRFGLLLLIGLSLLIIVIRNYFKTPAGRKQFDRMNLGLPIFGKLNLKVSTSRFLRTLGTLYSSGVPILQSLEVAKQTMGNTVLARRLSSVGEQVGGGESIAEPLRMSRLFSPMVIRMISTGEKAGALDQMLDKAADFYDLEIENTVERLSALLEPLILLVMGGLVGFIMASTLLPMFQMVKLLRH